MNRKYTLRICKCGRIHAIPDEKFKKVLDENKEFLLICGGCGKANLMGADIVPDINPEKKCYEMYTCDFGLNGDEVITESSFKETEKNKAVGEIFYSHGYPVPMKTGQYADNCFNGKFTDMCYPDFYEIQRNDITAKEVLDFIDEYNHDRTTVDMDRFIKETPDDVLEELSHYGIEGLNWSGTKFAK